MQVIPIIAFKKLFFDLKKVSLVHFCDIKFTWNKWMKREKIYVFIKILKEDQLKTHELFQSLRLIHQ